MASRRDEEAKGFLSRWSQRKREAEEEKAETPPHEDAAAGRSDHEEQAPDDHPIDPADLPDIDTLDASSDYTVFMKKGVPPALRRRALNKLWQTDPAFRHICMLDDYNLDYTDAATVVPNLKTLFQVGRGMVLPEDEEAERARAAQAAAAEREDEKPGEPEATEPEATLPPEDTAASQDESKTPEKRRQARLPGTPLVAPATTPRSSARPDAPERTARSARRRRWGDSDN